MRRDHADLYALCRHDPEADAYFQALPEEIRYQLSGRIKQVNTFSDLRSHADTIMKEVSGWQSKG